MLNTCHIVSCVGPTNIHLEGERGEGRGRGREGGGEGGGKGGRGGGGGGKEGGWRKRQREREGEREGGVEEREEGGIISHGQHADKLCPPLISCTADTHTHTQ